MEKIHSPFHVIEDFVSPLRCELLISELGLSTPDFLNNHPLKNERVITDAAILSLIKDGILEHGADIQARYRGIIKEMDSPHFRQYFEDPAKPCEPHGCENAKYLKKKWLKTKDVDLVGYIWLKDYGSGVPLDPRHEVYGGKLEFPAYNFSLLPQRGSLVIFPAGPHFINAISPVLVGSLELVKFSLKLVNLDDSMYLYDPKNFPGSYSQWFSEE